VKRKVMAAWVIIILAALGCAYFVYGNYFCRKDNQNVVESEFRSVDIPGLDEEAELRRLMDPDSF
jgi:hypothetical protein